MHPHPVIASLLLLAVVALPAAPGRAATELCLEVHAAADQLDGARRLVESEVARHPSHRLVTADCQVHLLVELFDTHGALILTARLDQAVPVRYQIADRAELSDRVTEAVSLVLQNDPVMLQQDIAHYSLLQRAAHSVLQRGQNTWRLELYQAVSNGGNHAVFAPGAALSLTRGSGHWQVLARIYGGGWPGRVDGEARVLRVAVGADAGAAYEFSESGSTTFYLGATLGLQFLRFEGLLQPTDPNTLDTVNWIGVNLGLRTGVRFFRFHDFDCDLFAALQLPFHPTLDQDSRLFGDRGIYAPTLQLGLGVGF